MAFPIELKSNIALDGYLLTRTITLYGGITTIIGPNGSGKTNVLRGLKGALEQKVNPKKVRFLSAGRIGLLEQFRSNHDGHNPVPRYEWAQFGSLDDQTRRHAYETLQGDYQTLAARGDILIKVRERLRKLFKRDLHINWSAGTLRVDFASITGDGHTKYPSAREASGLLQLAGLLAAIYDDEVGALLIDEPEVSLHPQLQAFLLRELESVSGYPTGKGNTKLIVIGTHSTEFLKIDSTSDLPNLVFCRGLTDELIQVPPTAGELKNRKISELISRMGQEHKLAFFSKSPLLIEGPSDAIICAGLSSKLQIHIEAGGSQLVPVIGKGQFPAVVKFMRLLGKAPLVLADADAIVDSLELAKEFLNTPSANAIAATHAHDTAIKLAQSVYSTFCGVVDEHWHELAEMAGRTYEAAIDKNTPEVIARRRAAFSALLSSPLTALEAVDGRWLHLRHKLETLLELLDKQGCHILRKGAIENYYKPGTEVKDKTDYAAEEVTRINERQNSEVEEQYGDVIKALRNAAASERIDESEAIEDVLLSVAAPAFTRVQRGKKEEDLNSIARATAGALADLFDLQLKDGALVIHLKSDVLSRKGFPISIKRDEDLLKVVAKAIGTAKPD